MSKRLLDYDDLTKTATYHHYDHDTRITTIETVQDVEMYLRRNQAHRNEDVGGAKRLTDRDRKGIKEGWWHAATIPVVIQYKWLKEDGIDIFNPDHHGRMHRKLDSPEWEYLKTTRAKIGRYKDGR